ncbi:hypothetical protein CARUB_v10012684mg [Capsella rubella]|uniref:Uncharacterized protein n=1 Tax=Capsella rubella TaxID=81985 RepID=R0IL87_9BRAS|nr:hypothetical protein CARUB_v10012684mg [Capsella rubella]
MSRNVKTNKAASTQRFTGCSVAVAAAGHASVVAVFDFYVSSRLLIILFMCPSHLLFNIYLVLQIKCKELVSLVIRLNILMNYT